MGGMRRAAAQGFLWQGGQALFNRALSLVAFVVLARLLSPQDYGVVALANVFISLLTLLAAAGYSAALVQRPDVDDLDLDTIFWISLGTSVVLAILMSAAAIPLADAYHEPLLAPVLQVLSSTFVFVGLGSTHQAVLQRRLAFRSTARATMFANLVATIVGLAFAALGLGVWALVVQTVLGSALTTVALIVQSGYRPRARLSLERFWPMFETSRNYLGTTLMTFLNVRTDDFLIGSVLGSAALGVYSVGFRLLTVMNEVLASSARAVTFPIFARLQGDRERLLRAYTSAMRMCAVVAVPMFLFVAVAADPLVQVLFGDKWARAAPVMQVLCLFGAQQAVFQFNTSLLNAVGRARTVFRLTVASTVLQVAAFAVTVNFGLVWVASAYVFRAYLLAPIGLKLAADELQTSVATTLGGLKPPLVSSAAMVAATFLAGRALDGTPALVQVLAMGVVATVVYVGALRATGAAHLEEAVGYVRGMLSRRQPGATVA